MFGRILLLMACAMTFTPKTVMGQSPYPFVEDSFSVPDVLETSEFRLRMLTIDDVEKDYAAVMSSVDHLRNVWPGSGWRSIRGECAVRVHPGQRYSNREGRLFTLLMMAV